MQEAGGRRARFGDEKMRAFGPLAQVPGEIAPHAVGAFRAIAPWRQLEGDEARGESEDECVVAGARWADGDAGRGLHHGLMMPAPTWTAKSM
jgi:hypothetical protein